MRLKASILKQVKSKNNMKPPRIERVPIKAIMESYDSFVLPSRKEAYFIDDYCKLNSGSPIYYNINLPQPANFPRTDLTLGGLILEVRKKRWWEL